MATISEALAVAVQYQQAGNLQQAEAIYRQILQMDSGNAEAWCYLGTVCLRSGRIDEAVVCCRRAVALKPDFAPGQDNLAQALCAEEHCHLTTASNTMTATAEARKCNQQAIALAQAGRLEEAAAVLDRALRLKPDFAEGHSNLGCVFFNQGNYDQAVASYQQALRLKPDSADAHNGLASSLKEQGKLDEAD